ncbi:MAG: DNRLRE domain-containing protein [Actinomycetota bacterium]|nr:DNRLRE domain-containing protein [Actinomycetota bacterium]
MSARLALLIGLAALLGVGSAATYAAFTASTSNPTSTVAAKRIFPGQRTVSAWKLEDAANGTAADASHSLAYVDGITQLSKNWTNAWTTARYLELEFNSSRAAGLAASNVSFVFTFDDQDASTANQWCYYFETRKVSDGAVIQTHGSAASPIACEGAGNPITVTTPLPEITTTDQANDLKIRLFGMHSGGAKPVILERANVTSSGYAGYTLYPNHFVDAADSTPATTYWGPATVNGQAFQTAGNWAATYSASRYLKFTFAPYVPSTATLASASFEYTYRSQNAGDTTCYYFEVYAGATLVGTHGNSTGSDVDCNGFGSYKTISTPLPEVDTVAEANSLAIKLFSKNSGARPTLTDGALLKLTYSLDAGTGCADPGSRTVTATADTYVRQGTPGGGSNFGTATAMYVQPQSGSNRRSLVRFDLPVLGTGCSVTGATLRLFLSATGGARGLNVYQADSPWNETAVTWNTGQPGVTGSPASATTGAAGAWLQWGVTSIVQAMYSGANNGFVVRDANENSGTILQTFDTRETANDPELVVTFG